MKFNDEELTCIADNAVEYIERAIDELKGVKEYKEIEGILEDIKIDLLEESNLYRENYYGGRYALREVRKVVGRKGIPPACAE